MGQSTSRPRHLIVAFTALSLALVVVGWAVYAAVADSIRKQEIERLNIISDFKTDQIVHWLAECQSDIQTYLDSPTVIDALRQFADGTEVATRSKLTARLERTRLVHGYVGIDILGLDGRILVSAGETGRHSNELQAAVGQAFDQQEPILLDLHRSEPSDPIRMAYVAAIRDTSLAEQPAVGVVVLTVDPKNTLYPMLGSWPVPSGSGETLIVRRDGDDVLFLSQLRYRPDAAMILRFPVSRADLLAVQALTLGSGLYPGKDYRGVPVLAAVRPVTGTSWVLVAKVDREEVFAGLRAVGEICAVLVVVGVSVVGLLLTMAWRQQRLRDRIERLDLQDQFAKVAASVPGLICSFRLTPDGHVSLPIAGPAISDLYGLSPAEVADNAEAMFSYMLPGYAERVKASVSESARTMAAWHDEFMIQHPVKGERWIEGHSVPKREADGSTLWHGYLHDVTERKQAEMELTAARDRIAADMEAMGRLHTLGTLSADDGQLAQVLGEIVEVAVAITRADMGNIQLLDRVSGRLVFVAHRGFAQPFLDYWGHIADDEGSFDTAIARRERVIVEDVSVSPIFAGTSALETLQAAGVAAIQTTPLLSRSGHLLGVLSTHYRVCGRPDERSLKLLDLVARQTADIVERAYSAEQIRDSEAQLQLAQSAAGLGWWEWSIDTGAQNWSLANYALHDLDPAVGPVTYDIWYASVHPADRERALAAAQAAVVSGNTYEMDYRVVLPDGEVRWLTGRGKLLSDPLRGTRRMLGINLDITRHKQAETALTRANRLLHARHLSSLALLRASDEMSYLRSACEIVVAATGHFMMWIGTADQGSERGVLPIAVAGLDEGYLENVRITWADDDHGRGPTGTAIRTGKPSVCRDMLADSQLEPWRERITKHGYRSSVALPLIAGSETLGALTVYSVEPGAFPDDEVNLLGQIADDLANGISVLRLRSAHARAEQSLRESEVKLRLFIEHAPTALAMFDTDMRYMFASRRWLTDYHLEHSDILGKSHYEVFPEIPERWKEIHSRCLAGATETCDEDPFLRLDGRTDWLRWAIHPWYKDGGKVGGIVAMSEHITEQVEDRQTLRKLTLAVDQSPASILITNLDGNIEYVNETFTRVSGYSREEVLGRNPSFLGSGSTGPEVFHELWQALSQGRAWRGELHNRCKTGEEYVEAAWISPIRQQNGSVSNYLAIQEDVTERKRTEAELESYRFHLEELVAERTRQLQDSSHVIEERAAEIADLYNSAPCGYHSLDPTGLFVRINDTELSWLGYHRDEVVGRMRFPDLLDEDGKARFKDNLARFLSQGHLYDAEYDLRTKDGRIIPVVLSATAIRGEGGEVLMSRVVVYNLTDIKEAEKEAHRHARLAETFFEHSVACLVILDRDYNFLRVNAAYARACRQEIDDYKGRNHFEMYPSDAKLIFDEVVRTKRPFETFTRAFVFADQPERGVTYWDWTLVPILDHSGEVEFLVFSLNEVTQRKRAEEALRESEAMYRTLFDRSPDGIVLIDPETIRPIEFNTSAHESLGYSRDEFAALCLTDIDAYESEDDIRGRIDRIVRNSGGEFEIVHRTRNGEERNRTISVRTLEIQGRTAFHAIWHDITDSRRAQHAVEENERRLREITATLGEGLHVVDEQGRIVFCNPAACRLLGWSEDEMLGAPGHQLIHARHPDGSDYPAEDCELYRALMSDRALINHEDAFWTRDGRLLPVSVTLTTIHRSGRVAGAVLAFQDITERRKAEAELLCYRDGLEVLVAERTVALKESNRELAVARDKAEAANLAKSTFLANMSHELRTPLSAILGFTQLLAMDTTDGKSGDYQVSIDHILKNGRHLLALINDLLDLAKIDAGQVSVRPERIVLDALLSDIKASLLPLAEAGGVTISVRPCDGLPDVRADETKLNQVLLNLGSNAIKYNRPAGRVDITCELMDTAWLRVVVADTGAGIPEERRNDLFEPFNRLGRETGAVEGTGIGLALSRRFMKLMGGSIGYSAGSEGGSRFHIDIPVFRSEVDIDLAAEDSARPPEGEPLPWVPGGVPAGDSRTVLCVDDSRAGVELVALVIGGIPGTKLLTAGTAEEGIELARRHRPTLILMDINLPGMDGIEALTELRRWDETRAIPVFALSAAATPADIDKGLAAGFERYLTKPYDIHNLMAAVVGKFGEGVR